MWVAAAHGPLGKLWSVTSPDGSTWRYDWRADGRGRTVWAEYTALGAPAGDIRSRATVYGIDGGVGLVTERLTGGEPDRAYAYSYDGAGRLLSAVEAGQQVDYSDLELGGGAVGVTVDPVTPDDLPFERHFDLLGRLVSVGAAGDVLGLSWNANGTLAGIDGQGLSESWSDHPSAPHRPVEIELSSVDKSLTYDFAYDLSQPVDGIDWAQAPWLSVTVTEDGVEDTTKYGFDDQWRLARAEYPPLGGGEARRV